MKFRKSVEDIGARYISYHFQRVMHEVVRSTSQSGSTDFLGVLLQKTVYTRISVLGKRRHEAAADDLLKLKTPTNRKVK